MLAFQLQHATPQWCTQLAIEFIDEIEMELNQLNDALTASPACHDLQSPRLGRLLQMQSRIPCPTHAPFNKRAAKYSKWAGKLS